ncbi:YciI family protein [Pelomonas sp. SE-A7]|uniref:YciI family protein n=1 Tax=Pelomonas sp. SE-A7 TaxID=3054953 RepID=UPI00259CD6C0|nr:YciI family protein [Pelomonas sp. SE-A7]MDM4768093.1 YciI family protein [Pelomonas sp. SE-A7]
MTKRLMMAGLLALGSGLAMAQAASAPAASVPLFAVEFRTGPGWDKNKPYQEQAEVRAHSANLKKLRDQGSLVMGARYGEVGLVVLAAENEAAAHEMVRQDPSVKAGTFAYQLNEFSVFYGGTLQPAPRRR